MRKSICVIGAIMFAFCLCLELPAQEKATPGQVASLQSYFCYLPTKYTKGKKWPILYCFSSDGNARPFIDKLFKDVCEKHGWIVVTAKGGPNPAIISKVWQDTHSRFSINDKRCYSSGFSAGSGVAFIMAEKYADNFAGVIPMAMANTWARKTPDLPKHISVYFIMGSQDSVGAVKGHAANLRKKGNKAEVKVFSGGHRPPPRDVAEGAVEWMVKNAPESSGGKSVVKPTKPTRLVLAKEVCRRVQLGANKAARGDLAGALRIAEKIIEDNRAGDEEKEDAKLLRDEIEKLRDRLFAEAAKLLEEKKPYEAMQLYTQIRGAFTRFDAAKKAQDAITSIKKDESLKDELTAGKLYIKGLDYEAKDRKDKAKKCFEEIVEKYPDTEYAKRAKERM